CASPISSEAGAREPYLVLLAPQALEQACSRRCVLLVVEDPRVVELLEPAEIVRRVFGRVVARAGMGVGRRRLQRRPGLEDPELLLRPDLIRVDAGSLQPLAVLLDAEAALREAVRAPPPERPLLDKTPVEHHQPDGDEDAHATSPGGGPGSADSHHDPETDRAGHQADGDREPG